MVDKKEITYIAIGKNHLESWASEQKKGNVHFIFTMSADTMNKAIEDMKGNISKKGQGAILRIVDDRVLLQYYTSFYHKSHDPLNDATDQLIKDNEKFLYTY